MSHRWHKASKEKFKKWKDSVSVFSPYSVSSYSGLMTEPESLLKSESFWSSGSMENSLMWNKASFSLPLDSSLRQLTYFRNGPRPLRTHTSHDTLLAAHQKLEQRFLMVQAPFITVFASETINGLSERERLRRSSPHEQEVGVKKFDGCLSGIVATVLWHSGR